MRQPVTSKYEHSSILTDLRIPILPLLYFCGSFDLSLAVFPLAPTPYSHFCNALLLFSSPLGEILQGLQVNVEVAEDGDCVHKGVSVRLWTAGYFPEGGPGPIGKEYLRGEADRKLFLGERTGNQNWSWGILVSRSKK